MITWTKLYGRNIWKQCEKHYDGDSRRAYHNFSHIRELYQFAEELGFEYDPALDHAILAHDLVYDRLPNKEVRSVQKYAEMYEQNYGTTLSPHVYKHVLKTVDHKFNTFDNRMVILDLWGMTKPKTRNKNFDNIVYENQGLYGESMKDFAIPFLRDMYMRLEGSKYRVGAHYHEPIMEGVLSTIGLWAMYK